MKTLTFRNLDDDTVSKLQKRAAANGRSVKAELREIVAQAAAENGFKIRPRSKARWRESVTGKFASY